MGSKSLVQLNSSSNTAADVTNLGTQFFDIPNSQWSDSVDLTTIPKAIKVNAAGTYYIMAFDDSSVVPWVASGPEIIPIAVKRIGASTDTGLNGYIKGIL